MPQSASSSLETEEFIFSVSRNNNSFISVSSLRCSGVAG